jgi:hypothetical protein
MVANTLRNVCRMNVAASPHQRSKVTNGRRLFLEGIDGRSALARRFRDVLAGYRAALGRTPTASDDAMLRTATSLTLRQEQLAGALASGNHIDPGDITMLSSELRRCFRSLGMDGASGSESDADRLRRRREELEAGLR